VVDETLLEKKNGKSQSAVEKKIQEIGD